MLLIKYCLKDITEDAEDPSLGDDRQYHKDANTDCYPMPQCHDTLHIDIWRRRGESNSQTHFRGSNGFQDRAVRHYCSDANFKLVAPGSNWAHSVLTARRIHHDC